jgi:NADPH-dependent 2,4-dienoyl-CoA reductase/sulfur reductase-like enzyme
MIIKKEWNYMKVVVIGCTHAGTAAIVNISKLHPEARITAYERNDNISFLSCGIALYVGGVVSDVNGLFYSSPEQLEALGVKTRMKHDVLDVDMDNKKLKVMNLVTNEVFEDTYDKLIVTTGSWPIVPPLKGVDLENVLLSKNFSHSEAIIEKTKDAKNVVVVGAGYIGVELVEAFRMKGKNVTLIDQEERIMKKYLDKKFSDVAENELSSRGVKLALGEKVLEFAGRGGKVSGVVTDKKAYAADLVILCIGFRPNTELFMGKLDMLPNGAIITDDYMHTSKADVFAAGDSAAVKYNPTGKLMYIPLATNAVRMGTLAARNLVRNTVRHLGTQGTSGIKIYDYSIAATGLTEEAAKAEGMEVMAVTVTDNYRPEFMPYNYSVTLKVVYDKCSRLILGAQLWSKADLTQSINTLSACIQNKMKVEELAFVDFFFQPQFNKPWNFLNFAGLSAE